MTMLFKRFSIIGSLIALGILVGAASAQTTTVSVTVVDSTSTAWINGTISYVFRGNGSFNGTYQWQGAALPGQYLVPTTVQLNGSGSATFTVPTTTTISPSGSSWTFTICPHASAQCSIIQSLPIVGNSQNISSTVTSMITPISINASNLPLAYSDSEIKTVINTGGGYYNTGTATPGARLFDGSSWGSWGGGSGGSSYFLGTPTVTVTGTSAAHFVPVATSSSAATMRQLTADDILPAFNITSFGCDKTGNYEIGTTVNSPTTCTAAYTSTPVSASLSDGINSTVTLTTPFTSGVQSHSYTLTTQGAITQTLTAIGATTKTATASYNFLPRSFFGPGTSGATGATASGSTAILVGATGTLADGGLGGSNVGQTFTVTTTGTQYIYLLLTTNVSNPGGGSFTIPGPAVFPMNTPTAITFVNQNGSNVPQYLYMSVNQYTSGTTFAITVGN